MSAEEIGEAIRVEATRVLDTQQNPHVSLRVHPDDWAELVTDPPRSLFEDGDERAVFGCTVSLDDTVERGAPVAT